MEYDDLLKVVNNSDHVEVFGYANKVYPVKPGGTALVPFPAVCIRLGDPRSGPEQVRIEKDDGSILRISSRKQEINRLSVLYGTYDPEQAELLLSLLPDVTVTNMEEDSEPIVFPCEDPLCTKFTPIDTDQSQIALMQRQLDKLRRTQVLLEQQLKGTERNRDSTVAADKIEEDTPSAVRKTATRG